MTEKAIEKHKTESKLDKKVFNAPVNNEILALYVRVYMANQRQGTSSTKTRADVSGGGIKPWKQKGTGRARAGSRRAPHWVHGGIAHGPKPKDWSLTLTQKMKQAALRSALALRQSENSIVVLEELTLKKPKTAELAAILKKEKISGKALLVIPKHDDTIYKAGRNIKNLSIESADVINAYDILNTKTLVLVKDSVTKLEKRL